ncbi:MAG: SPOR domain-containing protein [Gammaproteobacteria bacterium]|jgi:DedD protein
MELKLKQRLVGAVVLVALAVIFIPVILEGPSDEWEPRSHSIPVPPQIDYKADVEIPVPDEAPMPQVPQAAGPGSGRSGNADVPAAEPVMEPVAEPDAEVATPAAPAVKPAAPAADNPPPAAAPASGWFVQVGSFGQRMNASGLRERLGKAGFSAQLEESATDKGTVYRVLVGPEEQRAPAERLRDRLAAEQQLRGIVIER